MKLTYSEIYVHWEMKRDGRTRGIGKERQSGTLGGQEGPTRKVTFEERCGAAEGVTIANTWENSIPGKANSPNKAS